MLEKKQNPENYLEHRSKFTTTQNAAKDLGMSIDDYRIHLRDQAALPMSENRAKFREDWTAEDCIAELQSIARIDTTKIVTRNFFRNNSSISESTWNRYFGTFEEFKKQAGIVLKSQQKALERDIAKHVRIDHYRALNERNDWSEDYKRDHKTKWKTILVGSDFHDIKCDPFFLRVFLDTAKRLQPTDICLNGDIFDTAEFSRYYCDPREYDAAGRVKMVWDYVFDPLRKSCPSSNIDLIEGNHELRLLKTQQDNNPGVPILLDQLHGITTRELLGLDRYEINYISNADAGTWTRTGMPVPELKKNWKTYYNTFVAHHYPPGKKTNMPGWNGHHHKHVVWPFFNHDLGACEWHQLGAGHVTEASYCDAALAGWGNGFLIAHVNSETRSHTMEYIQITDVACVGGKYYHRTETENWKKNGLHYDYKKTD